jgi:hypothetical protein
MPFYIIKTSRMNPNINNKLRVSMICQQQLINCNKFAILVRDVHDVRDCADWGGVDCLERTLYKEKKF